MSSDHERLFAMARDFPALMPSVVEGWASVPETYREGLIRAGGEGALLLAEAATGDVSAVRELSILHARISLWSWAGAEHARRAMLNAWKAWLADAASALAGVAAEVVARGLEALVASGLEDLADRLD